MGIVGTNGLERRRDFGTGLLLPGLAPRYLVELAL